jgi:hypothetical protein
MQVMRMLGGRRFVFVGLPPIGCLPIARTLLGRGPDGCDSNLNQLAASFNSRLIQLSNFINFQPRLRSAYIDTYTIIRAATDNPQNYGMCFTFLLNIGVMQNILSMINRSFLLCNHWMDDR